MADDSVTAVKLTSQLAVTWGHMAKISSNLTCFAMSWRSGRRYFTKRLGDIIIMNNLKPPPPQLNSQSLPTCGAALTNEMQNASRHSDECGSFDCG